MKRVNPAGAPSEGVESSNGALSVQSTTGAKPAANGLNQPNGSTAIPYRTKANYADAMRRCLIVAIEAAHAAEKHGAGIGRPLQFSSADIQGVASTLFIQASRDGWIEYAGGAQ